MNISCRIANADTQCGRITNPPERETVVFMINIKENLNGRKKIVNFLRDYGFNI